MLVTCDNSLCAPTEVLLSSFTLRLSDVWFRYLASTDYRATVYSLIHKGSARKEALGGRVGPRAGVDVVVKRKMSSSAAETSFCHEV
jgi:hypothetical protein